MVTLKDLNSYLKVKEFLESDDRSLMEIIRDLKPAVVIYDGDKHPRGYPNFSQAFRDTCVNTCTLDYTKRVNKSYVMVRGKSGFPKCFRVEFPK